MIVGRLESIREELSFYPEAIRKGISFLLDTDFRDIASGTFEIEGKNIFAKVSEYDTQPIEERRPERHEKYIDIQCIIEGAEQIGCGLLQNAGKVDLDAMEERDILYYDAGEGMKEETFIPLHAGGLLVIFPWDVHRPNCRLGENAHVKKAVVKVAMASLKGEA